MRGQRVVSLSFVERRKVTLGEAMKISLDLAVDLPKTTGWLRIEIPDQGVTSGISPAALEMVEPSRDPIAGKMDLNWRLVTGEAFRIGNDAPEFAFVTETGFAFETEDGETIETEEAA